MKSLLAVSMFLCGASAALAQDLSRPLPSVVQSKMPASAPAAVLISRPTNWEAECRPACPVPQARCATPVPDCSRSRMPLCQQIRNWLTFRICEPNHTACVPMPYHAPLRTYFPHTPAPIGFNGPLDCSPAKRVWGFTPKSCATSNCAQTSGGNDVSCPLEKKNCFARFTSMLGLGGCGISRSPMGCGPTCAVPGGFNYHYAGNQSAMIYPGVPTPVSATRPFTNP